MSIHTSELQALSQLLGGSYKEPGYEDYDVSFRGSNQLSIELLFDDV